MSRGGGSSEVFGIILGAAAGAIAGPLGFGAVSALGAVSLGVSVGLTARSMLEARRLERAASENRRQATVTLRTAEAPRARVYGKRRVGGTLVYWTTWGPENRKLSMVIVLADHPCEAIDDVLVDDKSLGALDASGYVQFGSPWFKAAPILHTANLAAVSGVITLPFATITMPTVAIRTSLVNANPAIPEAIEGFTYLPDASGANWYYSTTSGVTTITLEGSLFGQTIAAEDLVIGWQSEGGYPLARVRKHLGAIPQTADSVLTAIGNGEWTSTSRLDGQTYIVVDLEWDETRALAGIPNISAILRGYNGIYDPRTATTGYTDNWALCVRDYLVYGFGATSGEINDADVIDSANTSDETLTVDDGAIKRYTVNAVLYTDATRADNMETLLIAGAGSAVWTAGQWRVLCGKYRSPVSITLGDSDVIGSVQIRTRVPRKDLFNSVRGTFSDARAVGGAQLYTRTSYVPYKSSAYVTEDNGEEITRTIDFDAVTDYRVAHRIAKQVMHRSRQAQRVTAPFSLVAVPLQVGDVVTLALTRYGISGTYEVIERAYSFPASVQLTLQETSSSVYDWSYTEVAYLDPAPNTMLASPVDVQMPLLTVRSSAVADANGDATFDVLADGSVVPYVSVSWPARTVGGEYVVVQWRRIYETAGRKLVSRAGETSLKIDGVSGGDRIHIEATAVNSLGASSPAFILQNYEVDPALPGFAGATPALSANLLRNASLDVSTAAWSVDAYGLGGGQAATLQLHPTARIAGTPSSAYIAVTSGLTGNASAILAVSSPFSVTVGTRIIASAYLIGYATDAYIGISWYSSSDQWLQLVDYSNVIPGGLVSPAQWNDPAVYTRAVSDAIVPAGAALGRLVIYGQGNWNGSPVKYVSFLQPFAGQVALNVSEVPAWDPGGQNVVDTALIGPSAATSIVRSPSVAGPVPFFTVTTAVSSVVITDDLRGFDVAATITLDYTARNAGGIPGVIGTTMAHELVPADGVVRSGTTRTLIRSNSLPAGYDVTQPVESTQRWGIDSTMAPPYMFRVRAVDKFAVVGGTVQSSASAIDFSVEVVKR